ncbi:thioesterase domain-containing protein [Mycolicibacterium sp. BK634]|uniref:thioesterase domain-containing protein n=1 Tax=Mycolicibacterium sp. BK634 TaxID=2587099 RepID=UPI00160EA6F4|nr:thioesterase domain-containing protein [Mycolicibacterium sp. BK634]
MTDVATTVCGLIGHALGVDDVAVDEDFFELGGTSLLGTALLALIERQFGQRLRLADLYEAPTARGLAQRLIQPRPASGSVAVLPRPPETGDVLPVFVVHQLSSDLMRQIACRRPVVGLSYGMATDPADVRWPLPVGIEALATHYLAELRRVRPVGPYHLVGYSLGGVIAWEMARQLGESGDDVGLLCLIDTAPPGSRRALGRTATMRRVVSMPPHILVQRAFRRIVRKLSRLSVVQRARWRRSDQVARLQLIDHRMDAYRMQPVPGRLLLVEATEALPWSDVLTEQPLSLPQAYEAAGLAPNGVVAIHLPGDHGSIVSSPLADQIAAAIEETIVR